MLLLFVSSVFWAHKYVGTCRVRLLEPLLILFFVQYTCSLVPHIESRLLFGSLLCATNENLTIVRIWDLTHMRTLMCRSGVRIKIEKCSKKPSLCAASRKTSDQQVTIAENYYLIPMRKVACALLDHRFSLSQYRGVSDRINREKWRELEARAKITFTETAFDVTSRANSPARELLSRKEM